MIKIIDMDMDRKELFFNLLGSELSKEGFKFKKSGQKYIKKENGNEYQYIIDSSQEFLTIEPNFRILIKDVEEIKKKAWGTLYDKYESVGENKRYLLPKDIGDQCWSWTDTENAVRNAVQKEIDFYYSFVKDYFMNYSDINFLNKHLNTNPNEERIVAHNQIHTSFLAIIVAFLTKNSLLKELIPFYKAIIEKFNNNFMDDYILLEKYILKNTGSVL